MARSSVSTAFSLTASWQARSCRGAHASIKAGQLCAARIRVGVRARELSWAASGVPAAGAGTGGEVESEVGGEPAAEAASGRRALFTRRATSGAGAQPAAGPLAAEATAACTEAARPA